MNSIQRTLFGRLLAFAAVLALFVAAFPAQDANAEGPIALLDQSFTEPSSASESVNACCRYVAQTFTAGMTGTLTAVSVDVFANSEFALKVAIHGVTNGLPNGTVYSENYVRGSTWGIPQSSADLDLMINVGEIYVVAGQQYAIVVYYDGSGSPGNGGGTWAGATGNLYTGGGAFQTNDETFAAWDPIGTPQLDLHFKTYVVPDVPVSDLEVSWVSGARHAKACQIFDVTYRIRNLGPDPAEHVMLGMGLTDQFDMVSLDGVPSGTGAMVPDVTLAPGENVLVSGQVKVTAFVPQESRDGLVTAQVWSEGNLGIALDPNAANDYYFGSVRLISKPAISCPQ